MSETVDNKIVEAQAALGKPFRAETDGEVAKTRFRLLVTSGVALAFTLAHLHVKAESSLLGLVIDGLNDRLVGAGLLAILSYLTVHFFWCSVDGAIEWRLR